MEINVNKFEGQLIFSIGNTPTDAKIGFIHALDAISSKALESLGLKTSNFQKIMTTGSNGEKVYHYVRKDQLETLLLRFGSKLKDYGSQWLESHDIAAHLKNLTNDIAQKKRKILVNQTAQKCFNAAFQIIQKLQNRNIYSLEPIIHKAKMKSSALDVEIIKLKNSLTLTKNVKGFCKNIFRMLTGAYQKDQKILQSAEALKTYIHNLEKINGVVVKKNDSGKDHTNNLKKFDGIVSKYRDRTKILESLIKQKKLNAVDSDHHEVIKPRRNTVTRLEKQRDALVKKLQSKANSIQTKPESLANAHRFNRRDLYSDRKGLRESYMKLSYAIQKIVDTANEIKELKASLGEMQPSDESYKKIQIELKNKIEEIKSLEENIVNPARLNLHTPAQNRELQRELKIAAIQLRNGIKKNQIIKGKLALLNKEDPNYLAIKQALKASRKNIAKLTEDFDFLHYRLKNWKESQVMLLKYAIDIDQDKPESIQKIEQDYQSNVENIVKLVPRRKKHS